MASGFIEISSDKCYSPRWTGFDETIRVILKELKDINSTETTLSLIEFLKSRIPPANLNDGLEMGWGFIDEKNNDTVSRIIEFTELSDIQIEIFWKAANTGYKKLVEFGEDYSTLNPGLMKELIDLK